MYREALPPRDGSELCEQPGLPDARLAGDRDEPGSRARASARSASSAGELRGASDHHRAGRGVVPSAAAARGRRALSALSDGSGGVLLGVLGGARQDPQQVRHAVEPGHQPGARSRGPVRPSAMTRRSARRMVARATSSAADARVSPGTMNSRGISMRDSQVARSLLDPREHRVRRRGSRRPGAARPRRDSRPAPHRPRTALAGGAGPGRRARPTRRGSLPPAARCDQLGASHAQRRDRSRRWCRTPRPRGRPWPPGRRTAARSCRRRRDRWRRRCPRCRPGPLDRRAHRLTTSGRRRADPSARPAGSP